MTYTPSITTKLALEILREWEDKNTVYNLDRLQHIQGFENSPMLGDCCYLMNIEDDLKQSLNQQFYAIATTGEGGTYALWNYPELGAGVPDIPGLDPSVMARLRMEIFQEPPVVFFGGDGHYSMVAPSLEALVCLFAQGKFMFPEIENGSEPVWQDWQHWHPDLTEIADDWELDDDEEAKEKLLKKMKKFKKRVERVFDVEPFETYMQQMNEHKSFRAWYDYVEEHGADTKGETGGNFSAG